MVVTMVVVPAAGLFCMLVLLDLYLLPAPFRSQELGGRIVDTCDFALRTGALLESSRMHVDAMRPRRPIDAVRLGWQQLFGRSSLETPASVKRLHAVALCGT